MKLEEYFDFLSPDDIRLKNSRIGIKNILYEYIYRNLTPEEIADVYKTLSLEQVYATILYYLHNNELVSQYIADWLEWGEQQRKAQIQNQNSARTRLRKLKAQQQQNMKVS